MIRRVLNIERRGAYEAWKWPADAELQPTTIIYGSNGSGKSTLAQLLADAAAGEVSDSGLRLEVVDDATGKAREVSVIDRADPIWAQIRVFNRQYVERHLRFDTDDVGASALLTLGTRAIAVAEQTSKAQQRLIEIANELPRQLAAVRSAEKERDGLATKAGKQISEECRAAGGKFDGRRYTARNVKELLNSGRTELRGRAATNVALDLDTIREPSPEPVILPDWPVFDFAAGWSTLAELLHREIGTPVIGELTADGTLAEWVRSGVQLHASRDRCALCDGTITVERRGTLAEHFNAALADLHRQLDALDRALVDHLEAVDAAVAALPHEREFVAVARAQYRDWVGRAGEAAQGLGAVIEPMRAAIDAKRHRPFSVLPAPTRIMQTDIDVDGLIAINALHEDRRRSHRDHVTAAAERIEALRVLEIERRIEELEVRHAAAAAAAAQLEEEQEQLSADLARLALQQADPGPLAEELTRDLCALLGREDLVFARGASPAQYALTRNGRPAVGLSEGERTAISLLYFLASLRQTAGEGARVPGQIAIVDDPVSSLDASVALGVSSHLWRHRRDAGTTGQIVVLTHSFELLRNWAHLIGDGKRKKAPGSILELRMRYRPGSGGALRRTPELIVWPEEPQHRAAVRSEYHYMFWRVATTLQTCESDRVPPEAELDAQAIIPNAARKMLEGFFSFRRPDLVGKVELAVEQTLGSVGVADRNRLIRFLHQHSHNEQLELNRGVFAGEATTVLRAVFLLMHAVDADHFGRMCAVLELDEGMLLGPAPRQSASSDPPAPIGWPMSA